MINNVLTVCWHYLKIKFKQFKNNTETTWTILRGLEIIFRTRPWVEASLICLPMNPGCEEPGDGGGTSTAKALNLPVQDGSVSKKQRLPPPANIPVPDPKHRLGDISRRVWIYWEDVFIIKAELKGVDHIAKVLCLDT